MRDVKKMELRDTVNLMNSDNYNERVKGEYYQLKIRMSGLKNMLDKYKNNELGFTPNCSYDLLNAQYKAMELYLYYLTERMQIEKEN